MAAERSNKSVKVLYNSIVSDGRESRWFSVFLLNHCVCIKYVLLEINNYSTLEARLLIISEILLNNKTQNESSENNHKKKIQVK